jgi:ABC-type glycerol-3-phosphate transport system permease component
MKSNFFSIAGCFSLGLLLSNLAYLIPTHFWLFAIAGILLVIAMCFPGEAEILRRWSAVAILSGMLANNWELLGKMSGTQWGICVAVSVLVVGIAVAVIGGAGGQNE